MAFPIGYNRIRSIGDVANLDTTAKDELVNAINEVKSDVTNNATVMTNHKTDTMPHQLKDTKTNKTYKFGFQLSAEGNPQIIFEEVV